MLGLKKFFRDFMVRRILSLNQDMRIPRMIWGYQNANGTLCKDTRMSNTVFINYPERVTVADNVFVGHYTVLDGTGGLTIEEGVQMGAWVGIFTHSSHISIRLYGKKYTKIPEEQKKGFLMRPITIGKYTFLANGVKIFPGGSIGKGAFINTNAIIKKAIPDYAMVDTNGEIIGDTRELDKRYLTDPELKGLYEEWQ